MLSMLSHHSALGQFSTTLEEPATTSPPLNQNTTSSSPVEARVRINTLVFDPDGTGWLRLNSNGTVNGTVGPIIPFTHNFTEANDYTIYSSVPFFINNGSIVDLNTIDFSTEIIMDPSTNMTLPARPVLSPSATPDVSSLPPPPEQIETAPPPQTQQPTQAAPSPQQQQPGLSEPPTTTTTIPPPAAGTATNPDLQRLDQIANGCKATNHRLYPGAQTLEHIFLVPPQGATSADFRQMTQCNQLLNQAIAQYCNMLQTYDAAKCAYVNTPEILTLVDMTEIIAESDFLYSPDR